MINPIRLENIGDVDAAYWVAWTRCDKFLARGNDKARVMREANVEYARMLAAKEITPTTPNFENSDIAYLCRIGMGELQPA